MNDVEAAWLAAAIDGEGGFTIGRKNFYLYIWNTNRDFLQRALEIVGDGAVYTYEQTGKGKLPISVFRAGAHETLQRVLGKIMPYLIIKRPVAEQMLQMIKDKRWFKPSGIPRKEYKKFWVAKNRERWQQYMKEWRLKNKEHRRAYNREYYQSPRGIEARRRYYLQNRGRILAQRKLRREARLNG